MKVANWIKRGLLIAGSALALQGTVLALEVGGVTVDDSARVANTELKLNGAGVRTKVIFKLYVAALYLPETKASVAEVLASPGPRRMSLTMLREVTSDALSQALLDGLNNNVTPAEKSQMFNQMLAVGQIFGTYRSLKPKDVITLDWVPGTGSVVQVNGKRTGDPLPDQNFYNALLKIWLGDKPADKTLKPKLLGLK